MKKNLFKTIVISLAILLIQYPVIVSASSNLSSEDEAIVNFDESEIYASFDQVNDLVSYVSENEAVTYSNIQLENNSLIENVSSSAALAMNTANNDNPLIVGAFWYGCMFPGLGILVVAFVTDNDSEQVRKAVTGCLVSTVGVPVLVLILQLAGTIALFGSVN